MHPASDADPTLTPARYRALFKVAEAVARHGELAGLPSVLPVDFLGVILHTDGAFQLHVLESWRVTVKKTGLSPRLKEL
jgi:hypothetical protein